MKGLLIPAYGVFSYLVGIWWGRRTTCNGRPQEASDGR